MPPPGETDEFSVNTEDAADVIARFSFIVASLEKAGVPPEELDHFKQIVGRLPLANNAGSNAAPDDGAGQYPGVVAEGALEKLQGGTQGFAPVWKSRWIRVLPGELQVFESAERPEKLDSPCLIRLPLSVQQTRIEPGKEVLSKRLGREDILMVSSTTAVGGTLRCVTLAAKDNLALEKWMAFLEKRDRLAGASIFRASQTGDIFRVKELVSRGQLSRRNAYGCTALHYAVKHAAECAVMVARGGDGTAADQSKIRAQEALRVVVYLMSHGADARAANNLGETPLELGSRLTSGFPKSRNLLLSILESSKYQVSGGTIFIVPAAAAEKASPRRGVLASVAEGEEGAGEREGDETTATPDPLVALAAGGAVAPAGASASKTTTARGVTFSPSRRNRRARRRCEIAKSRLPYVPSSAAPSFGEGRCRSRGGGSSSRPAVTPALPRGDHETILGGARHRLAAGHGARCSRNDQGGGEESYGCRGVRSCRGSRVSGGGGGGGAERTSGRHPGEAAVGVNFKNYRMGRSTGVLVGGVGDGGSKRRRRAYPTAERPVSCPARADTVARRRGGDGQRPRPATTVERRSGGGGGGVGRSRRGGRGGNGGGGGEERGPSIPDCEARRQISEWLRESAGTASAVPPAAAHGAGEYLAETSSYVATGRRSDVYKALQAIKGNGRGELISAEKLRAVLCRVGQPLLPNEMDELLQENDPTGTGYVSCSRLSKLVASERLKPLAPGTTYNEEDDVVLQAKARRLARTERLARTAANAQQAAAAAAAAEAER